MPIGITKLPHRHAKITKEIIWGKSVAPDLDLFQGRLHGSCKCYDRHARGVVRPGTRYGTAGGSFPDKDVRRTLYPAEVKWKAVRRMHPLLEAQWRYVVGQ